MRTVNYGVFGILSTEGFNNLFWVLAYLVSSPTLNAVYWYLMNKILDILVSF